MIVTHTVLLDSFIKPNTECPGNRRNNFKVIQYDVKTNMQLKF